MTYDFVTNSSVADAHLTNLYPSKYQGSYSAHTAAMAYNYLGMPMEKIVIGAAFYGKIRNYNPDGSKTAYRTISYTDIKNQYLNNPNITYVWDEDAKAPLLINDTTFITFDDVNSIKAKCEYVKNNNLAGIMFWQYNHDETGDLLNAIYMNIRG
jgi:chitinase